MPTIYTPPSATTLETLSPDETLRKRLEVAWGIAENESKQGILQYLNHVTVNCVPPKLFRDVAKPWQWTLSSRLIPAIEYAANLRFKYTGPRRFWLTLPKGHDKTSLVGRLCNWAMAFSRTNLTAYAAAKDRDQSGYLLESMRLEANLNPWLKKRLQFKNWDVKGHNYSTLHIQSTDAGGTAGYRGDLVVCDEITEWEKEEFFYQIVAGLHKRPRSVIVVITNAGIQGTWQWEALRTWKKLQAAELAGTRQMEPSDARHFVYEAPGELEHWMSKAEQQAARMLVPPIMARKLYDNVWVEQGADCQFITAEQARACEDETLPADTLRGKADIRYWCGVDYGASRDRTVITVVHREEDNLVIDKMIVLQGTKDNHVPVDLVENWMRRIKEDFQLELLVIDAWQMESTIQKMRGIFPIEVFQPRSAVSGNYALAENLRELIVNHRIRWNPACGSLFVEDHIETLSYELARVSVKIVGTTYRIFNDVGTHDDRTISLGMCALYAMRQAVKRKISVEGGWW